MSEDEFKTLLEDVKSYLKITWKDEKTDKNLTGILKRGMARLKDVAGVATINFIEEDLPRTLLFDYCRYANSQALEMFEVNFMSELLSLHLRFQAESIIKEGVINENKTP